MYMEKCVLACNSGGPTETIVNERTGFLCPPDAYLFSRILLKAVKSPGLIVDCGRNGKKRVERVFAFDAFSNKLNRIVESL